MEVVSLLSDEEMRRRSSALRSARPRPPYGLVFPRGLWERATAHLQMNGARRLEQLVLWSGYAVNGTVAITSLLLPETEAEWGWVRILPPEQPQIVDWLIRHGQLMFAETHTHRGQGAWATEMSEEDRRHPAGRQDGFLTIIVPAYARHGMGLRQIGVWECRDLAWNRLSPQEVAERVNVANDEGVRHALA